MPQIKEPYDPKKHFIIAKPNCPKCYGRGYVGFNKTTQQRQPCSCLRLAYKPPENPPVEETGTVTILEPEEPKNDNI